MAHPTKDSGPTSLSALARSLKETVAPDRWEAIKERAQERAGVVQAVRQARETGLGHMAAAAAVAPEIPWSTYLNWWRHDRDREGEPWERQLDARLPPAPETIPDGIRAAACLLRRMDPTIGCEEAASLLVAQFGPERGSVSATSLKRIWKDEGLEQPRGGFRGSKKPADVTELTGGGGMALLAAAVAETGVDIELGKAAVAQAQGMAATQDEVDDDSEADEHRDEQGRFTAAYNHAIRGSGEHDPRWDPDGDKRGRRRLDKLSLVQARPELVGDKFLALGASALLTERRGFDGLANFNGAWLEGLGIHAYMPATLDKFLAEMALVDAGDAMWQAHGRHWKETTAPWRTQGEQPHWRRHVVYVDATQDPYWTRKFATSGKVSRVGRTMPCITRVALMGGPGVPLAVETRAGTVSLKTELLPFLARMEDILGEGELGRLTVVDAEMATIPIMRTLAARSDHWFVSVLKGSTKKAARQLHAQPWQRYRKRDLIRSMELRFGKSDESDDNLVLRGVEMIREGSRNPTSTLFVTNATQEELTTDEVPTVYLSRWPHQEQRFRDTRNGLGLDRSHGYGGEYVQHVALSTKLEKAQRRIDRTDERIAKAQQVEEIAKANLDATERGGRTAARKLLDSAMQRRRAEERKRKKDQRNYDKQASLPREIYVRDTTRDGIVTCAKLTVLMLIEFALQEYFGGLRMEARSFIEAFLFTPVSIHETDDEVFYQLKANPRDPKRTEQLRAACQQATHRTLRNRADKLLRFEVVDDDTRLEPRILRT